MTDEKNELPEAFQAEQVAANDEANGEDEDQFGLGRLVESHVPEEVRQARREASDAVGRTEVGEASRESFPASDPPAFNATPAPPPEPEKS